MSSESETTYWCEKCRSVVAEGATVTRQWTKDKHHIQCGTLVVANERADVAASVDSINKLLEQQQPLTIEREHSNDTEALDNLVTALESLLDDTKLTCLTTLADSLENSNDRNYLARHVAHLFSLRALCEQFRATRAFDLAVAKRPLCKVCKVELVVFDKLKYECPMCKQLVMKGLA